MNVISDLEISTNLDLPNTNIVRYLTDKRWVAAGKDRNSRGQVYHKDGRQVVVPLNRNQAGKIRLASLLCSVAENENRTVQEVTDSIIYGEDHHIVSMLWDSTSVFRMLYLNPFKMLAGGIEQIGGSVDETRLLPSTATGFNLRAVVPATNPNNLNTFPTKIKVDGASIDVEKARNSGQE